MLAIVSCGSPRADEHPSGPLDIIEGQATDTRAHQTAETASENNVKNRVLPRIALLTPTQKERDKERTVMSREPFGLGVTEGLLNEMSAKWADLQSRVRSEQEALAACRADFSNCPASARLFLHIHVLRRKAANPPAKEALVAQGLGSCGPLDV